MKKVLKKGCMAFIVVSVILIGIAAVFVEDTPESSDPIATEATSEDPAKATPEKSDIEILQTSDEYEPYTESYTIHVRVRNNTDKLISYLQLNGTWFDSDGKIVGTGIGNTTNFASGAEKTIDVHGMSIQNAANYEVQIENVMY